MASTAFFVSCKKKKPLYRGRFPIEGRVLFGCIENGGE